MARVRVRMRHVCRVPLHQSACRRSQSKCHDMALYVKNVLSDGKQFGAEHGALGDDGALGRGLTCLFEPASLPDLALHHADTATRSATQEQKHGSSSFQL
eukprot:1926394-Rhodomonas_salina.2